MILSSRVFRRGAAICATLLFAVPARSQMRPPPARLTPILNADAAPAGSGARLALQVQLPPGLHANPNRPRDPGLIAMVLSVDAPAGLSVDEIVYPEATDLVQRGAARPLRVFEQEFVIGVAATIARNAAPGILKIPARLRYQACDAQVCYFPATVRTEWTLRIVPAGTRVTAVHPEVFGKIRFQNRSRPPIEDR